MFSIYEYDGRVFRNTLEELYKIKPPSAGNALIRAQKEQLNRLPPHPSHVPNQRSIEAYKTLIHANPKDELHHAFEIMQEDFPVIKETQTVYDAVELLSASQSNTIPIVGENNRILGLFDQTAILKTAVNTDQDINYKLTLVKDFLMSDVITAEPVTSIRRIAQVIYQYNLIAIPIVDSYDALVGLVSHQDIAKAIANDPPISLWT